ncbi:MAG: serine acetyltransferase [Flavobacteriales bacterium]|nr:MAG: serine acetyltransferase [Flavobacteriales bacterium]
MTLLNTIRLDIKTNNYSKKATIIVVSYRIAHYLKMHKSRVVRALGYPLLKMYQVFVVWNWGIEIPCETQIGLAFNLGHGNTVVVNGDTVIGNYVLLRQYTTIGNKGTGASGSPVIGDHVEIGANCVIIGDITIGNNVTIGAGSVVTKSIPPNSIAYGNPLKIIGKTIIGKVNPTNYKKPIFNGTDKLSNNAFYANA